MNQKSYFNKDLLKNISKEFAYVLGLLWADGYFISNSVGIELLKNDLDAIKCNFDSTGFWLYSTRKRENRQETATLFLTDLDFKKFLDDNGYLNKKQDSANKVLNILGIDLEKYWLLGLIDGDGNINIGLQSLAKKKNKKWLNFRITIFSSINQDWSYLEKICNRLEIKYKILKRNRLSGKGSEFNITGKQALKFCNYVYSDDDFPCLLRKKQKYKTFSNYKNEISINRSY